MMQHWSAPRVGFLTNIYTPYKEPLLALLAQHVQLKVYYCARIEPNRNWAVNFSGTYEYEVLKGRSLRLGRAHLHMNPQIVNRLRRDKPDVLIVGGYGYPTVLAGAITAKLTGAKLILWSGNTSAAAPGRRFLRSLYKRLFIGLCDGFIAYSSHAAAYLHSLGADPLMTSIAPITVDVAQFNERATKLMTKPGREALRAEINLARGDTVVLFVGAMHKIKGGDILLRALAQLAIDSIQVLMVGDGPQQSQWVRLARELGLRDQVRWCGYLSQSELIRFYASADIFVLPSRQDRSGNVINEAAAVGLPIITTENVGTDVVRDGKEGFVVPAENVEQLANKIELLILNPSLRELMGASAKQRVLRDYSLDHEVAGFLESIYAVSRESTG